MIPFSPPRIDDKTLKAVNEVLLSGWITTGPKTREFETELTAYCSNRETLCVSSATAGLELILRWFGVGAGDEVILPAYTYCATANVVLHCGATPVMVDIGSDFNISAEAVSAAITDRTKVVIPVDIGGLPCDYPALQTLVVAEANRKMFTPANEIQEQLGRILLLADAAHSIGARYDGRMSGSLCDVSVFSFHAVKNITTAEGGAICLSLPAPFDNGEVYQYLKVNSLHGQSKDALAKQTGGNWRYDVLNAGYKCNMTDIQAAMGLVELQRYDETLLRRRKICGMYNNGLQNVQGVSLPIFSDERRESSRHLYMLRLENASEQQRDQIIARMYDRGVAVNVHFIPLPLLSLYNDLGYRMNDYPNAYSAFRGEISLPLYFDLSDEQVNQVITALKDSMNEVLQ